MLSGHAHGVAPRSTQGSRDRALRVGLLVSAVLCTARDGLVDVCDRGNNRFQVFQKSGAFVKEQFIARDTKGAGSVWDIEFSLDDRQRFMFVADGTNERVWILDRESLNTLGSFGSSGNQAGQFATPVHDLTIDSKGSIYTGEAATAGRVQKFTLKE